MTEIGERLGDWIQLISGEPFWPLDPRSEEVELNDIAWALSMQCRYAGHVKRFYSVAEHSIMVSRQVPAEHALWGLLHDATEAYLVDLPRPIKQCMPEYRLHEDYLAEVIAERFGLPWPMPAEVKQVDTAMLFVERGQLLAESQRAWGYAQGGEALAPIVVGTLPCWSPGEAYGAFLDRFAELNARTVQP